MEKIKLGDVASVITKGTTPTSIGYSFIEKGINFIKIESISEEGKFIKEKLAYISEDCNSKLKRSQLKENDILFSIAGAIGRVAVVNNDIIPANTNQALAIIRIDNRYDKEFLAFLLRSSYIKKQYNRKKQGVAQINLSLKDISELEIPVIDIKKQIEIKETLKKIIEIITLKKGQIENLDNIIKSQFVEMFENEKYPKKRLIDVCEELFAGGDVNKEHTSKERTDKYKYPIYTNGEKLDGLYGYTDIVRVNKEAVTISGRGTIGFSCIRKEPFYPAVRLIVAVPNKNIIETTFLRQFIENKNYGGQGASIPQLTVPMIKNELIPVPPIELQNQFADIVKLIDKQKFESEIELRKIQKNIFYKWGR